MAKHVLLNNVEHGDLRVITRRSAQYGDDVMCALTFPAEFRSVQAHYPIFFRKAADSGQFQPFAMFGLRDKENLFLDDQGWDATYIPMTIERQPFLIGIQPAAVGPVEAGRVVAGPVVADAGEASARLRPVESGPVPAAGR